MNFQKCCFILFGASGNLAKERIYPALYALHKKGIKFQNYVGYGRSRLTNNQFYKIITRSIGQENKSFLNKFNYIQGPYDTDGLENLAEFTGKKPAIFYLAIPSQYGIIESIFKGLEEHKLLNPKSRFVIEKPIGHNYKSANRLINFLKNKLDEKQVFFIDHYLGKDMVRNLTTLRFANPVFENLWNNQNIKSIRIETSEKDGIKDRGEYYDGAGAIKDMIQNHSLQMLSLLTMDQPKSFIFDQVAKAKSKSLKNLRLWKDQPANSIKIGQYKGYQNENHVHPNSLTETMAELIVEIDTDRWRGVPITIFTGKKLKEKRTEIIVTYKPNENCPWSDACVELDSNQLIVNIYPNNSIILTLNSEFQPVKNIPKALPLLLDFKDQEYVIKDPYLNALMDIYHNEKFYVPSFSEVLLSWQFIDKVLLYINKKRKSIIKKY